MAWFLKRYECCGTEWTDEWSCACNDECPTCGAEIEPYDWDDLTYVIEHNPAEREPWTLLFSPDTAEDDPDYEEIGAFATKEEAEAFIVTHEMEGEATDA